MATYFCAPDGRVLHAIAGPVDAKTFLAEARWVIETSREIISESKGDARKFKERMRSAHADRLQDQYGARVTPVFSDQTMQNLTTAVAYRDAAGRHLAPVLPLPPIENANETRRPLNNQGKVHQLLAAHATMKIESLYGVIFETILGEKVTTKPVVADTPFRGR